MSLKILTVDDSKTIRMIVKKAFKPYNCELFEGENGIEGMKLAMQEIPDLIVLDITMPVMNGIEMLSKLKEDQKLKNIPVIMLTAESGKDNVMQIVKMGVNDYIVKPFKGEQLIERAQKIVKLESEKIEDSIKSNYENYLRTEGNIHIMTLPEKINRQIAIEINAYFQEKIKDIEKLSKKKILVDLNKIEEINVSLIKLIILLIGSFEKENIKYKILGSSSIKQEFKGFQETCNIEIHQEYEEAIRSLQSIT